MMPQDIANFLDTAISWLILPSTALTTEEPNFFIMDMPDLPDSCVAVYQYGGQGPEQTFGNPALIRKPRLQVVVRDRRADIALTRAEQIYNALSTVKSQIINGSNYAIIPLSEPFELGPDVGGRERLVCNYSVWKG